jgi:hemerythrin
MAFFDWNEKLSVGIEEIDNQHKGWLDVINELNENIRIGKSKEILKGTIEKLVKYTEVHFSTEEKYMTLYNYPELESHKNEHKEFTEKVFEFRDKYNLATYMTSLEVMDFLKKWLMHHILETDKKYSPFLIKSGLK